MKLRTAGSTAIPNKRAKIFFAAAFLLTLFRVFLAVKIPLFIQGNAAYDDFLMVRYAAYMVAGQWLGPFSHMVCVKGITFPLFLALNYLTGLPWSFTLILLNILSAAFIVRALKPWLGHSITAIGLYLFLIYSPVTLATQKSGVVYRDSIIAPVLLVVLGCAIGLYLRRDRRDRTLIPWAAGLGLSFALFWNIREDTIWLLPFVVVAVAVTAIGWWRQNRRLTRTEITILILPFFCLLIFQLGQGAINYAAYGQFMVNDRTATLEADVMADLIRLDDGGDNSTVWISKDGLALAYKASPTLAQARDGIAESLGAWGCADTARGLTGDITVWAIRDGVMRAGHYQNAAETEAFYAKIHSELKAAYASGQLTRRPGFYVSKLARSMTAADGPLFVQNFVTGWKDLIHYNFYTSEVLAAIGPVDRIRTMEVMANATVLYPEGVFDTAEECVGQTALAKVGNICARVANGIIRLYQLTGAVLTGLALVGYVVLTGAEIRRIRRKQKGDPAIWLVLTGLWLSSLILMFGVVWFTSFMQGDYAFNLFYYTTPVATVLQVIQFLTVMWGVRWGMMMKK